MQWLHVAPCHVAWAPSLAQCAPESRRPPQHRLWAHCMQRHGQHLLGEALLHVIVLLCSAYAQRQLVL